MTLNIVCFHGFTQNSDIIKKKLAPLIKSVKNINLYYLDGTIVFPTEDTNSVSRAYWIYDKINPLKVNWMDHYISENIYHINESFESFINLGKEIGKIDGIIGFSQGGCFVDYICKMHEMGFVPFDLKFAIMIASESFNRPQYEFNNINPKLETLHIYGLNDSIILPSMSESLANQYPNKEILIHNGTHVIPSNSAAKNAFKKLLTKFE